MTTASQRGRASPNPLNNGKMRSGQIILLATPVFFALIAIEFAVGRWRALRGTGHDTYALGDSVNSIGLGVLSQVSGVLTRLLRIGIYTAAYSTVALFPNEAFWTSWYGWLLALVFYDFCYYWLHRMGHESAILWAAHVVHHQSEHYNLTTALRQTSSGALLGWIFYLPMAIAGVPPLVFGVVALVDLLYQYWVHTEQVGKLGWFDRWFCSPSNHRVHHAVNDRYLDHNYGGILIIWDRIFGTFKEEDEPCVYGTRSPLRSWDPLWANAEVYWALARDSWRARRWSDKLRIWFKPPGWRPAELAERYPRPDFDINAVTRYAPPASRAVQWFAAVQFVLLVAAAAAFLWYSELMPFGTAAVCLAALTAMLWAIGGVLQGRLAITEVLWIEAAALATASGVLGIRWLHLWTKPLALLIPVMMVAALLWRAEGDAVRRLRWLLAALAGSLAGDVLLMWPEGFLAGVASFLLAHLAFIALLRDEGGLFPRRAVLALMLGIGAAMYAFLWWGGLPAALRVPVAAYVVVIAAMGAQAVGRAAVRGDTAALGVAVGACFFMLSDALLSTNRFVVPLPLGSFWVLSTYYLAQMLIVRNVLREISSGR